MSEPAQPSARSIRSEPFVGVAVLLAWLFASAALGLVATSRGDAEGATAYANAPICPPGTVQPPAGTEPAARAKPAAECRQRLMATVRDTPSPQMLPDHLTILVEGAPVRVEPATEGDARRMAGLGPGATTQAVRWRGAIAQLGTPFGDARTGDDPAAAATGDRILVGALFGLAAILALVAIGPAVGRLGTHLRALARRTRARPRLLTGQAAATKEGQAPQVPYRRVS